jgi:hypothetical protein
MKRSFYVIAIGFLAACNANESARVESIKTDSASKDAPLPFFNPPSLTAKPKTGKSEPDSIDTQLNPWNHSHLENLKEKFGDPATLNAVESIFVASKPYRDSVVDTKLHSWMPLQAAGKPERWALVWYTDYLIGVDGKKDSTEYQEIWRINKSGKATVSQMGIRRAPVPTKN